jgi:hypothetical protein
MKPNKKASLERRKAIQQPKPRPSKGQDSNKVHNTKGKNYHSRSF